MEEANDIIAQLKDIPKEAKNIANKKDNGINLGMIPKIFKKEYLK